MVNLYIVNHTRRTFPHDSRQRRYTLVTPGNGDTSTVDSGANVVLFLHGSLQSGSVARRFTGNTFDALTERGCVVIYPDGVDRHFNDHRIGFQEKARQDGVDDVGFLSALVSEVRSATGAGGRLIGCGFSNGGQMIQRLAIEQPGLLDGIATFGAPWPTADNILPAVDQRLSGWVATPVLTVQGTADPLVPYNGGTAGIGAANRGEARSALDSARYFAALNGFTGAAPVTAQSRDGVRVDRFGPGMPGSGAYGPHSGSGSDRSGSASAGTASASAGTASASAGAASAGAVSAGSEPVSGGAPVELWTIEGMGHLVPNPKQMDEKLGPGTDKVVGAELVAQFFEL